MATRTAKLYSGEDKSPIVDYTDLVIWEESEFGTRAWQGEGSASSIVIRDPLGETGNPIGLPSGLSFKTLPAKSLFVVQVGSDFLFRGRVGIKNYTRDGQHVERYRQVETNLHDTNWDLDHITVHNYARGQETDQQRVQGLIASYLSGSPRPTTALNGSNFIAASNTVTLAAKTYTRSTPLEVLRDISTETNKQFFVTGDAIGGGSLFWDGNDSAAYACTFTISDRESEVRANPGTYWPPIWNVGPASTEDGSELIDEVYLFYGTGEDQYVTAHDLTVHTQYGHASTILTDDTTESSGAAQNRAGKILAHREYEDKTYNVTIGPLTDAQVVLVKHGQTINIKARAITDADDQFRLMRIAQCRYTTPVPGTWFAHLQLGRPWKMSPYGTGPTLIPKPPAPPVAGACTRLYFNLGNSSVVPAISAGWEVDGADSNYNDGTLTTTPGSTYSGGGTGTTSTGNGTTADIRLGQYMVVLTTEMAAILAAGGATIRMQARARARHGVGISEASQDLISQMSVRVTQGASATIRGTALAMHGLTSSVGSAKWPAQSTHVNRIFPPPLATNVLSAVSGAAAGDYLAIEFGYRTWTTVASGGAVLIMDSAATDLPEDQVSTTNLNSWVEICTSESGDTPAPTVLPGDGSFGSETGCFAPCDHNHPVGTLSSDGDHFFDASGIQYSGTGSGLSATNVQQAIDEAIAGSLLGWFNVRAYGALGDGATDDTSAINDAIAAMVADGGGVLYFPKGTYLTSAGLSTISVPCIVRGDGSNDYDGVTPISLVTCTSATANLFTVTTNQAKFENIAFENTAGGTPSAGSAISTQGAYLEQRVDYESVVVHNFWIGFDVQVGGQWTMHDCFVYDPVKYAVKIQNTVNNDAGDWSITNCEFSADAYAADAAIRIQSSGGGKISNCKINVGFPPTNKFVNGIDLAVSGSTQTSVLLIANNSFENMTGHAISGTAATGGSHYFGIVINGNQFGMWANNSGKAVSMVATDAGDLYGIVIGNNVFHTNGTARSAVQLTNCDSVTLVGNQLIGNFTSQLTNTGSTNVTEVGGDLTAHLADASDAHDASAVSIVDAGGYFTGTDVEAALQEVAVGSAAGHYEVVVSGSAPPVAVTNTAETDWVYGWVPD